MQRRSNMSRAWKCSIFLTLTLVKCYVAVGWGKARLYKLTYIQCIIIHMINDNFEAGQPTRFYYIFPFLPHVYIFLACSNRSKLHLKACSKSTSLHLTWYSHWPRQSQISPQDFSTIFGFYIVMKEIDTTALNRVYTLSSCHFNVPNIFQRILDNPHAAIMTNSCYGTFLPTTHR